MLLDDVAYHNREHSATSYYRPMVRDVRLMWRRPCQASWCLRCLCLCLRPGLCQHVRMGPSTSGPACAFLARAYARLVSPGPTRQEYGDACLVSSLALR